MNKCLIRMPLCSKITATRTQTSNGNDLDIWRRLDFVAIKNICTFNDMRPFRSARHHERHENRPLNRIYFPNLFPRPTLCMVSLSTTKNVPPENCTVWTLICDGLGYFGCARSAIPLHGSVSSLVDKCVPLCSFWKSTAQGPFFSSELQDVTVPAGCHRVKCDEIGGKALRAGLHKGSLRGEMKPISWRHKNHWCS